MIAYVIQGAAYGFAAAAQPGPFQTYLISQTLARGPRRTLPMIAAPLLSDGPILVLVLLVLSRLPSWWVPVLETVGGMFVVYLGVEAWRSWRGSGPARRPEAAGGRRSVFHAAIVNLLNPAPYLFWSLVTGPILITGWREAPANAIGMLIAFYGTMIGACLAIVLLFGTANRLGTKVTSYLQLTAALALAGFGLYHIGRGMWVSLPH